MRKLFRIFACVALLMLTSVSIVYADDFSFTGNFTNDNDVQLFSFSVGANSNVTLRTWSYAGGTNAAGQVIARGGFDPILAVFNSTGVMIGQNDDGGPGHVPIDLSGRYYDTYLGLNLGAGNYQVSVMVFNNFATGPNLSNGFTQDGIANIHFTQALTDHTYGQFWDVSGSDYSLRDSHWAFDILNVNEATENNTVPEPATMLLLGLGLVGLAGARRKFKK